MNQLRFCEGREVFDRIMEPGFPGWEVDVDGSGCLEWRPLKKGHFTLFEYWKMIENDDKPDEA